MFLSPLNWPGGKGRHLHKFLKYFPNEIKNYCEPFFGGGAVGLYLIYSSKIKNIIVFNDLNKNLMNFWQDVKNKKINFGQFNNISNEKARILFEIIKNKYKKNQLLNGWEFLYLNRLSWGGIIGKSSYMPLKHKLGYLKNCQKNLFISSQLLKNSQLYNDDWINIVKKYDSKDTFFYFDPPYEKVGEKLYDHGKFNLAKMSFLLESLKGKFVLSINDSKITRELFKNFNIYKWKANYSLRNNLRHGELKPHEYELIITNFKPEFYEQMSLNFGFNV